MGKDWKMSQNECLLYDESVKKTIESCSTAQAMIDINAKHLEGLRTECAITAELTQNEIRTLEVSTLVFIIFIQIFKVLINCRQNS